MSLRQAALQVRQEERRDTSATATQPDHRMATRSLQDPEKGYVGHFAPRVAPKKANRKLLF